MRKDMELKLTKSLIHKPQLKHNFYLSLNGYPALKMEFKLQNKLIISKLSIN